MTGVQTCALPICFPATINGIGLHGDSIEEIERKKAINQMNKLLNLTNRKKAKRKQIRKEEEDIMYQYLSAEYCPF